MVIYSWCASCAHPLRYLQAHSSEPLQIIYHNHAVAVTKLLIENLIFMKAGEAGWGGGLHTWRQVLVGNRALEDS